MPIIFPLSSLNHFLRGVCVQSEIVLQLIKSHQVLSLQSKEDKFIGSINMQLKLLQTYPLQQGGTIDVHKGFRTTFMVILAVRVITGKVLQCSGL